MDNEKIIKQGLVIKPFEARVIDEQLSQKVKYFKELLVQLRIGQKNKTKHFGKIKKGH